MTKKQKIQILIPETVAANDAAKVMARIIKAIRTEDLPQLTERDGVLWWGGCGWPDSRQNRDSYRNQDWATFDIWADVLAREAARREILRRDAAGIEPGCVR